MKVCPTCRSTFQDSFGYCPYDTDCLLPEGTAAAGKQSAALAVATVALPVNNRFRVRSAGKKIAFGLYRRTDDIYESGSEQVSGADEQASSASEGQTLLTCGHQIGLLIPEPANLFARLGAAISQYFKEVAIPQPTAPQASLREGDGATEINILMPETDNLVIRLAAAMRDFAGSAGKGRWRTPFVSIPEERDSVYPGFSIPEPAGLIRRLGAAVRQFAGDLKRRTPPASPDDLDASRLLLAPEPLVMRLGREIVTAAIDLRRNPRNFLISVLRGEGSSRQRRQLLQSGAAIAVIAYSLIFSAFLLAALFNARKTGDAAESRPPIEVTHLVSPSDVDILVKHPERDLPKGKGGFTGGSKPKIQQAHGGGGGGRSEPTPPSKGVPPPMALAPQIVLPNPEPPKIKNPILPVPMTTYGDPKALPDLKGPIGDPRGIEGPPSSGPGKGAGIGTGEGTGVGPGQGRGVGPGRGGNAGGGDFALGGGKGTGGSGGIEVAGQNGVGIPVILYKEKARYTEDARQNKIQGTVVLSAVFTADGRVSNIQVVRGLPEGLTESAIDAARKVRFQPATKNGAPVSVRIKLEFNFALY